LEAWISLILASDYGLDDLGSISGRGRDFSLCRHRTSYPIRTGNSLWCLIKHRGNFTYWFTETPNYVNLKLDFIDFLLKKRATPRTCTLDKGYGSMGRRLFPASTSATTGHMSASSCPLDAPTNEESIH
jgi:hypothetical protein